MSFKPVIFLAFANDKVDNALYLRNLSIEMHGIRKSLNEAVSKGLCEVIERSSATIADIVDVFSDSIYGSRISIFHYGGHADGFSLLLESEDGTKSLTHKDGLVPFLAKQNNLKLIFLNGCSSGDQTTDLLKAGIPAVIGTTASINDEIATALAIRFYSSLGEGAGIEKAWIDATDEVKIKQGTGNTRALFWEGKKEKPDGFPWVIQFKPGAEIIKEWNLPDISGNPLYGLPDIPPTFNLPESPFLYLNRYERKHAEIFFGRSFYIRSLYASIVDKDAPPILLFYGQSGVGKSSLLDAGLQPRLELSHTIIYLRRNGKLGLRDTVYQALLELNGYQTDTDLLPINEINGVKYAIEGLKSISATLDSIYKPEVDALIEKLSHQKETISIVEEDNKPLNIMAAWSKVESTTKKPLLIILDQVEEAYTRPHELIKNEVELLFKELILLFGNINVRPLGKIILSFRKEYHPEIEKFCTDFELPRSKVFLEHITKNDIIEIFNGFVNTPKLKSRYNLSIEDGLPEVAAADLAADDEAPLAPMLQILLTKLWNKASDVDSANPKFSHKIYKELKDEGLAMDEFLQNQLIKIKTKLPAFYQNGFVLDVLNFYTTPNNTSAARSLQQLHVQFPFAKSEAEQVLAACKELFLITDLGGADKSSMLAHDTLAKSVVKIQQRSAFKLQQAKRVLNSRIEAIRAGSDMATLDEWDLKLMEEVQTFLPVYSDEIKSLMAASKKEIIRKQREKKLLAIFKWSVAAISFVGLVIITIQYRDSQKKSKDLFVNHMAATSTTQLITDPTKALQSALSGMALNAENSIAEIKKAMTHAYYLSKDRHLPWYVELYDSDYNFHDLIRNDNAQRMIPFANVGKLTIYDYDGKEKGILAIHSDSTTGQVDDYFEQIKWSQDGNYIITMTVHGYLHLYDKNGKFIKEVGNEKNNDLLDSLGYLDFGISPLSDKFFGYTVSKKDSGHVLFYDMKGNFIQQLSAPKDIVNITYSADATSLIFVQSGTVSSGKGLSRNLTESETNNLEIMDLTGKVTAFIDSRDHPIKYLYYSPTGKLIVTIHTDDMLSIRDGDCKLLSTIKPSVMMTRGTESANQGYILVSFHPNDSTIAYTFQNGEALLDNIYDKKLPISIKHDQIVTSLEFSPNGKYLFSGSSDNTAALWDMKGSKIYTLLGHTNDVTHGFFQNDNLVITTSLDGSIKKWDLSEIDDHTFRGHGAPVTYIDINPSSTYLVSCGMDQTMRIWDLNQRKEIDKVDVTNERQGIRYVTFINENEILGMTYINQAFIYNMTTKKKTNLIGHKETIEWGGNIGDIIITASQDGSVRYWNKNGRTLDSLKLSDAALTILDVSVKASMVAVGDNQGFIYLLDAEAKEIKRMKLHFAAITYLAFSPNGKYLVSSSDDGTANIIKMDSITVKSKLDRIICAPYNDCTLNSASFSNNSEYVVTTSSDRTIRVWNLNGDCIHNLIGHTDKIVDAYFAPNDSVLYSYGEDKTLRLWGHDGKEINTYTGHHGKINAAYLTNDMNHIYTASDDGTIRHWWTPIGVYRKLKDQPQFSDYLKNNTNTLHNHK